MWTLVLATLLGCKSDDGDSGDEPQLDTFTINLELGWVEVGMGPLAGATVAFDDGAGVRTEVVSDADGKASFEVDWNLGPAAVSIDPGQGMPVVAFVGVTAADDGMVMPFVDTLSLEDEDTFELSGVVTERTPDTWLIVEALGAGNDWYQGVPAAWSIEVLPDTDFELLGLEFTYTFEGVTRGIIQDLFNWTRVPVDGLQQDTSFDLVLSDTLVPGSFEASYYLPDDTTDPLWDDDVMPWMVIYEQRNGLVGTDCGWPTWMDINADGTGFDMTGEYVISSQAEGALSAIVAQAPGQVFGSIRVLPAPPEQWTEEPTLLPLPHNVTLEPNGLGTWTITLDDPGVDVMPYFELMNSRLQGQWVVIARSGTELVVPLPPSTVDAPALVDSIDEVHPYLLTGFERTNQAWSWGEPIEL